jgi:hypothetical protein
MIMSLFRKIRRRLILIAMAPLSGLENKERNRKIEERLKRSEQKHNYR